MGFMKKHEMLHRHGIVGMLLLRRMTHEDDRLC
jgi:hypothetical protein